ncbi:hypothetical protein PFISCL1PPCAC_7859, partial [Pristionchus fissidentatus]
VSKTCTIPFSCAPSEDCPKFTAGTSTEDAKLECEGGKWLINNEYYENIQPVCKDDEINENRGAFYMHYAGVTDKLTEGQCFQKYDFKRKTKLDISPEIIIKDGIISCTEGNMRVKYGNITYDEKQYKCNNSRGIWMSDSGKIIKENSRVMCIKQAPLGMEAFSTGALIGHFTFIPLTSMALAVLGTCIFHYCKTRKDHIYAAWSIRVKSEQFVFDFGVFLQTWAYKSSQTTPSSMVKIIDGLNLIQKLLDSETEDPDICELAWPFLDRLHGSS